MPLQESQHTGNALGLADIRMYKEVDVVLGCGLGGTSLINANVVMKPVNNVFKNPEWPEEVQRDIESGLPPLCSSLHVYFSASKEHPLILNQYE